MKKTLKFIVIFAVLLVSISAYSGKIIDASNGYIAPSLNLRNEQKSVSLENLKGKYVLLSFWSSTDALSRVACNEYTAFEKEISAEDQFCLLSVNFDQSNGLFQEIVRRDNLNPKSQFYVQGDEAKKIKEKFHLEDGYNSLLIDPTGRIISTNPSTSTLKKVLNL